MDLSPAEQLTLQLIAAQNAFGRKTSTQLEPLWQADLWPQVLRELEAQTVLAFPADVLDSLPLSEAEKADYLARVGRDLSSWYHLMAAQSKVLSAFRREEIPVAVLKGAAAAINYPQPIARGMGDIDLIVPPAFFDTAFRLMKSLEWENVAGEDARDRHAGFAKKGYPEVELHRFFSTCANKRQAQALNQVIYDGIPHAQWRDVSGFSVPVLPPKANGVVLLAHINQHLGSGLGLRQVLDWQMFVQTHLTDVFWKDSFQQEARNIGMEKLAITTTALCEKYLGLCANATWFDNADAQLVDNLLIYIVRKGNMGRKVETGAQKTQTVLHSFRNPVALVRYLYEGGCVHWKTARNHRWLAPAACLYQVGHILRKGFERGAGIDALSQEARNAKQEVELLKRLGVTRI